MSIRKIIEAAARFNKMAQVQTGDKLKYAHLLEQNGITKQILQYALDNSGSFINTDSFEISLYLGGNGKVYTIDFKLLPFRGAAPDAKKIGYIRSEIKNQIW